MTMRKEVAGTIVDPLNGTMFPGAVVFENGKILEIQERSEAPACFIIPGFIDAHVHIESSMLVPSEFARLAVRHGTVATVSDPHEIANVLGEEGVLFMIENASTVPLKIFFGAPSCVPATSFETAGAVIDAAGVSRLLDREDVLYLAEMMNFPGVLYEDPEVHAKLLAARQRGKPIDGHAPGMRGADVEKYCSYGISTDHECVALEEALAKIRNGMKIAIREGSAAKNYEALAPLLGSHPESVMFCSDDKHPDNLRDGHINELVVRAVAQGYEVMDVLRAACCIPVQHYGLPVGLLQKEDSADFLVVNNLQEFKVLETYIAGDLVAVAGKETFSTTKAPLVNNFSCKQLTARALEVVAEGHDLRTIKVLPGQLLTEERVMPASVENGLVVSDVKADVLKLVVYNRYADAAPAIAFVHGLGLQKGAFASSIAHDSHNIVAAGCDDVSIARAVNVLVTAGGGIAAVDGDHEAVLPLPVAGLMSNEPGEQIAEHYEELDALVKALGSGLPAPFMSLSFLALLVIPQLKLSDKGLFDGGTFSFVELFPSKGE